MSLKITRDFLANRHVRKDLEQFYEKPVTRVSLELIVSIVTVMLFALLALRPTLLTMSELLKEIEEKRELDTQLGSKIAALSTAQSEYTTYASQIRELDTAVFRQASLEEIAYFLEYLARQNGLEVTAIGLGDIPVLLEPPEDELDTTYTLVRYDSQIALGGDLASIREFIRRVESVRPIFSVDSFSLNVGSRNETGRVEANIRLGIYVYEAASTRTVTTPGGRP